MSSSLNTVGNKNKSIGDDFVMLDSPSNQEAALTIQTVDQISTKISSQMCMLMQNLMKDNQVVMSKLAISIDERMNSLDQKVENLTKENKELHKKIDDLSQNNAHLSERVNELVNRNKKINKSLVSLKHKNSNLLKNNVTLKRKNRLFAKQNAILTKQVQSSHRFLEGKIFQRRFFENASKSTSLFYCQDLIGWSSPTSQHQKDSLAYLNLDARRKGLPQLSNFSTLKREAKLVKMKRAITATLFNAQIKQPNKYEQDLNVKWDPLEPQSKAQMTYLDLAVEGQLLNEDTTFGIMKVATANLKALKEDLNVSQTMKEKLENAVESLRKSLITTKNLSNFNKVSLAITRNKLNSKQKQFIMENKRKDRELKITKSQLSIQEKLLISKEKSNLQDITYAEKYVQQLSTQTIEALDLSNVKGSYSGRKSKNTHLSWLDLALKRSIVAETLAIKGEELQSKTTQLATKEKELKSKTTQLAAKEKELENKITQLAAKEKELAAKEKELENKITQLLACEREVVYLKESCYTKNQLILGLGIASLAGPFGALMRSEIVTTSVYEFFRNNQALLWKNIVN